MDIRLKDPEEVKEYIKNLGIEYRFSCFHENRPDGCHLLGDYLEAISQEFSKSAKVYKQNCDQNNYGHSCYKYGACLYKGQGVERDNAESWKYFVKGCDLNYPKSCLLAGATTGSFYKQYRQALSFLEKGCEANNSESCHMAAGYYIAGKPGIEKNTMKALELSTKACEMGNMYACANASQIYAKGDGVPKNEELAEKYKKIALDIKDQYSQKPQVKFGEIT